MATDEHPSTDMLYQRVRSIFPTISFDTSTERCLPLRAGLAEIVGGTGNSKRFDGDTTKHLIFNVSNVKK